MILAKNKGVFEQERAILPMSYAVQDSFWQGGRLWLSSIPVGMTASRHILNIHCHSLPVPIQHAPTLTNSMPATCPSPSGWARTRPSAGCTVKPAADASANAKARSWQAPNCPKQRWCASSNVCPTAVPSRRPPTFAKWMPAPLIACLKWQADAPRTSTISSLKNSSNPSKPLNSMNSILAYPASKKRGERKCSLASRNGSDVDSRGSGIGKPVCDRPAGGSSHPGNGRTACRVGGVVLQRGSPAYPDGRAFALSESHFAGIRPYKVSATKARPGTKVQARTQAAAGVACGGGTETAGRQRQPAQGQHPCFVWQAQRYPQKNQEIAHRQDCQHLAHRTAQRDYALPTAGQTCQTKPQRLAANRATAMVDVAVAGRLQLDARAWLAGWPMPRDGARTGTACVVDARLCAISYTRLRSPATRVEKPAYRYARIGLGQIYA